MSRYIARFRWGYALTIKRMQATSNSQRIMHIKITQDIVRDASIHSADDDMYVPADDKEPNFVNAASTVV